MSVSQEKPDLRFVKPVVAQDTGGAIRGPIRFDFFWGFGDDAGAAAGRQKSRVEAGCSCRTDSNPGIFAAERRTEAHESVRTSITPA